MCCAFNASHFFNCYLNIMAQTTISNYFNTRKRTAADDKIERARKVLILDGDKKSETKDRLEGEKVVVFSASNNLSEKVQTKRDNALNSATPRVINPEPSSAPVMARKANRKPVHRRPPTSVNQTDIQELFKKMAKTPAVQEEPTRAKTEINLSTPESITRELHVTPPTTPTKRLNRLDNLHNVDREPTIKQIREKLTRSHRLAELRASISRFKDSAGKLEEAEQKIAKVEQSPTLKAFKTLEFEVNVRYVIVKICMDFVLDV